jgi:hypothetical protein
MSTLASSESQRQKSEGDDMSTKTKIVAAALACVAVLRGTTIWGIGRFVLSLVIAILLVLDIARAAHLPWEVIKVALIVLVPVILVAVYLSGRKSVTGVQGQALRSASKTSIASTQWRRIDATTKKRIAGLLAIACFAGIPPYTMIRTAVYSHTEQAWASTKGLIQTIRVESTSWKDHTNWYPVWTYTYVVDGMLYRAGSTDLKAHYRVTVFPSADAAAKLRPVGTEVAVFYDPNHPQHSVLDRSEMSDMDWEVTLLTLLFPLIPLGGAAALYGIRSRN